MQIVTLQTKEFKGLSNDVHTFGNNNIISGRNGSGKSSLAEAVIFALYGRSRTGNASTSDLIHEAAESCLVAVEFDTGTIVLREESRLYGPSIKLNGELTTQQTLDAALPDFKAFISTFLVGYFGQQDESDQRALLLKFAPEQDFVKLFNEYTRKPEILEKHEIDFDSIDKEHKQYKKMESSLKDSVIQNGSKAKYAAEQMQSLKKPKARIDTKKVQEKLDLIASHAAYNEAIETNSALARESAAAASGRCPSCNQKLSADDVAAKVKQLESRKLPVPPKPTGKLPKTPAGNLQLELNEAAAVNALFDNYEEQMLDLQKQEVDAKDAVTKAEEQLVTISVIVEALSAKGIRATAARQQIKPVVDAINKFTGDDFPVRIETLEQLKTRSDMKEVFKLYANEIPYKFLSTGEKKRIDIAISQAVNSLLEDPIDMFFVDDAELISSEYTITGQVFKAYVASDELTIKEG